MMTNVLSPFYGSQCSCCEVSIVTTFLWSFSLHHVCVLQCVSYVVSTVRLHCQWWRLPYGVSPRPTSGVLSLRH